MTTMTTIDQIKQELRDIIDLEDSYEINRSIPMSGKWDTNAWEACEK